MAIKTMSASTGGGSIYSEGWHEAVITKAEYGTFEKGDKTTKYLDVWFENYGEYQYMRVYELSNKKTNEEFAISNTFKYANAGILSVLDDPSGKKPIIQYDDEAKHLIGKTLNIYIHPDPKNTKYNRIFRECAPIEGQHEHQTFTIDQVNSIKGAVESRYTKWTNTIPTASVNGVPTSDTSDLSAEIPF